MPIFSNNKGKLELVSEISITLERDIQNLVESNMKTIFNLNFVASEYESQDPSIILSSTNYLRIELKWIVPVLNYFIFCCEK